MLTIAKKLAVKYSIPLCGPGGDDITKPLFETTHEDGYPKKPKGRSWKDWYEQNFTTKPFQQAVLTSEGMVTFSGEMKWKTE